MQCTLMTVTEYNFITAVLLNILNRHDPAQGRNHGWKVEGDQGLGPNTKGFGVGGWVQEEVASSSCEGPGVSPRKFFWKLRC